MSSGCHTRVARTTSCERVPRRNVAISIPPSSEQEACRADHCPSVPLLCSVIEACRRQWKVPESSFRMPSIRPSSALLSDVCGVLRSCNDLRIPLFHSEQHQMNELQFNTSILFHVSLLIPPFTCTQKVCSSQYSRVLTRVQNIPQFLRLLGRLALDSWLAHRLC